MEKYALTGVAGSAENPYPLGLMKPEFRKLFRDLVTRRTDLENHYKDRDDAFAGKQAHDWQRELNRRWARWAEAESAVRDLLRESAATDPPQTGEDEEPASIPLRAAA